MTKFFLLFSFIFVALVSNGQGNSPHNMIIENIPGNSDSVKVTVNLVVDMPKEVEVIELRVGPEKGEGNFLSMSFYHFIIEGKHQLRGYEFDKSVNGKSVVNFSGVTPKMEINKKCFLSIEGKNKTGNIIYTYSKKIK